MSSSARPGTEISMSSPPCFSITPWAQRDPAAAGSERFPRSKSAPSAAANRRRSRAFARARPPSEDCGPVGILWFFEGRIAFGAFPRRPLERVVTPSIARPRIERVDDARELVFELGHRAQQHAL